MRRSRILPARSLLLRLMADLATLSEQIDCAERELRRRISKYPALVAADKLTPEKCGKELAAQRAIVDTLMRVKRGEILI